MDETMRRLRAVDVYAGVGGWSLGLRLAGIDVVASYDRSIPANESNRRNNLHPVFAADIRLLDLDELPSAIDIVVGSPPCTQFSYSNRGGGGDIVDGMKDVITFLSIVDHLKPRFWAMENVPRLAKIIRRELAPGGVLRRFQHLGIVPHVLNMADLGLPQRRQRCIAGNFDAELLREYGTQAGSLTLGDIVASLSGSSDVTDPSFGIRIPRDQLTDHVLEEALNVEEVRINRSLKIEHPVYNRMPFPDPLHRTVRTVTATCTRVSRESVVIEDPERAGVYRRLSIRERASLQGFPISFQFHASGYGRKLTLVGNAIPPMVTFLIGHAFKRTSAHKLPSLKDAAASMERQADLAVDAVAPRSGTRAAANRKFKFAIPSLRLPSGVRFELANTFVDGAVSWGVDFHFGSSKDIRRIHLGDRLLQSILTSCPTPLVTDLRTHLTTLSSYLLKVDAGTMQRVWSHRGLSIVTPFMLLDELDVLGAALTEVLRGHETTAQRLVGEAIKRQFPRVDQLPGLRKLARNANLILAGLLVGSAVNARLMPWKENFTEALVA